MFLRLTVALCAISHLQVIDLSQYSPTYFGPEHAQVLSSHLLHSSLPGLTSIEQMSLMALADTIATTSTDVDSQGKGKGTTGKCVWELTSSLELNEVVWSVFPSAKQSHNAVAIAEHNCMRLFFRAGTFKNLQFSHKASN